MQLHTERLKYNRKTLYPGVAWLGILGALAIVLSMMESVILPSLPFLPPGAKPGLSNIVIMFAASSMGCSETLMIVLFKSFFVLITRGGTAFLMSLSGGLLSSIAALLLIKMNIVCVSMIGISVLSAVLHNTGQLIMSVFLTNIISLLNYLPLLMIFGVISGVITGVIVSIVLHAIKQIDINKYCGGIYGEEIEKESSIRSAGTSEEIQRWGSCNASEKCSRGAAQNYNDPGVRYDSHAAIHRNSV